MYISMDLPLSRTHYPLPDREPRRPVGARSHCLSNESNGDSTPESNEI